jgi:hypothetical protein
MATTSFVRLDFTCYETSEKLSFWAQVLREESLLAFVLNPERLSAQNGNQKHFSSARVFRSPAAPPI